MTKTPSPARRGKRILFLVAIGVGLSILFPIRQLQRSRAELTAMIRQERQIQEQMRVMERAKKRLASDAEVERLAREHLHYVRPGEIAFAITGVVPIPTMPAPRAASKPAQPHRAWYQSFWHWLAG